MVCAVERKSANPDRWRWFQTVILNGESNGYSKSVSNGDLNDDFEQFIWSAECCLSKRTVFACLLPCASFSTKRPISSVEFWGRQIFHPSNQFYGCLKKFEFSNFKNEIVRHSARRRSQNRFKIEFGRPQVFMFCLYVLGFQLFACWSCFRCVCCLNCQISFNQFSLN